MSWFYFDSDCGTHTSVDGMTCRKVKARGGNMMMVEVEFKKGAIGTEHEHPHEQCAFIAEGEFEFSCGEENRVVRKGDSLYFAPGIRHGCRCLSGSGKIIDVFTPQREDFL